MKFSLFHKQKQQPNPEQPAVPPQEEPKAEAAAPEEPKQEATAPMEQTPAGTCTDTGTLVAAVSRKEA